MERNFMTYIQEYFEILVESYNLKVKEKLNDGQNFMIEFESGSFVIHVEKYFREFYVSLHKLNDPDHGIDLFNLLEYLKKEDVNVPSPKYFREEKDLEECFRKQLNHLSKVIFENYELINDYFSDDNYEVRFEDMRAFRKGKYPELYKRTE